MRIWFYTMTYGGHTMSRSFLSNGWLCASKFPLTLFSNWIPNVLHKRRSSEIFCTPNCSTTESMESIWKQHRTSLKPTHINAKFKIHLEIKRIVVLGF